jgi:RES domain
VSPLLAPAAPDALRGFPRRTVSALHDLHRVHRRSRQPWWFEHRGVGRFDLTGDADRGTCYLAEKPLGAFIEVFRDTALVSEEDVRRRVSSAVRVPGKLVLADCTRARARAFGVTATLCSTERYELTQGWARAFAAAAFDGIRYRLSHDPSQALIGVAIFGPRGAARWPVRHTAPIDPALIDEVGRRFGIRVVPVSR